jgi:hypothetical protein
MCVLPAAYVILWIPGNSSEILKRIGIVRRIMDAWDSGDHEIIDFLVSFTQWIGFVDAAICLWNLRQMYKNNHVV